MYKLSLDENGITFKSLEKEIYKLVCEVACEIMKEMLLELDRRLMDERDTQVYRAKGIKHTCIKTIMGTVEIDRRIYQYKTEEGNRAYKFLLDEYLGMDTIGHMSVNLVESIIKNVVEVSYRKTADNIKLMCNEEISHTAVWNIVQELGSRINDKEQRKIELNKQGKLKPDREVKVLFQEQDGIWLSMQGKDRHKKSKSKKRELKLGISYEGWKKGNGRKEQYSVENKIVCASFQDSNKFKQLSDATIAEVYNIDEIETRIINGDGASWIKASLGEEGVYYQLDPFHKSQAVLRAVHDKEDAKKLIGLLSCGNVEESLETIVGMMIRDSADDKKLQKLETLYNYLVDNKVGLIPYHLRQDIRLPEPPEGLEYRHLGTMEHNICDVLVQRMKGRKMSWSISGAENMSKILAEKFSSRLYSTLDELCSNVIAEDKFEKIIEVVTLSAAKMNKNLPKSKVCPLHKGEIPYTGSIMTAGRKVIRKIFDYKGFTEMVYR